MAVEIVIEHDISDKKIRIYDAPFSRGFNSDLRSQCEGRWDEDEDDDYNGKHWWVTEDQLEKVEMLLNTYYPKAEIVFEEV